MVRWPTRMQTLRNDHREAIRRCPGQACPRKDHRNVDRQQDTATQSSHGVALAGHIVNISGWPVGKQRIIEDDGPAKANFNQHYNTDASQPVSLA